MENLEAISLSNGSLRLPFVKFSRSRGERHVYRFNGIFRHRVQPSPIHPSLFSTVEKSWTSRVGFIIPANDLTKRGRSPKTFRIESSTPPSSSLSLSAEKLFSHLYSTMQSTLGCGSSDRIPRKQLEKSLAGGRVPRTPSTESRGGRKIGGSLHTNA